MFKIEHGQRGEREVITLTDTQGPSSASILPDYGFNCFSFRCTLGGKQYDVLFARDSFPSPQDSPTHNGSPILLPFPNRIRAGQFRYQGHDYSLPCNEHGKNAIHGFAVDQPWRIVQETADPDGASVTGEFQLSVDRPDFSSLWPGDFRTTFRYRLSGLSLITDIVVENTGETVIPFGLGTHPYFRFPLDASSSLEDCEIVSPAGKVVDLIECLPTGSTTNVNGPSDLRHGMSFNQRTFDDVFTDLQPASDGKVHHYLRDRHAKVELEIVHGEDFPYSVVYTPAHRQAICIEPYTCVTDAINLEGGELETGLWHLHPGELRRLSIEYHVREIP